MTKFFKENGKTLLIFLTIAIIFPIIILSPSTIGVIPYETGLTIIGYGGSILGGFLTLYGVWWTIEDNNKTNLENQRNQMKPILQAKKSSTNKDETTYEQLSNILLTFVFSAEFDENDLPISSLEYKDDFQHYLNLVNIGHSEMYNLTLTNYQCYSSLYGLSCTLVVENEGIPIFLPQNHAFTIELLSYTQKKNLDKIIDYIDLYNRYFTIELEFNFSDCMHNDYRQNIDIIIWIDKKSIEGKEHFKIESINFLTSPPILINNKK